ncbi:hypothetical protein R1flu_011175 [Riccia fluitans]|uniref:Uncharacterized protein n=1 Tax=Riccia fluitans TaxID=41844 RepID=A0ABD1Z733_9MARC
MGKRSTRLELQEGDNIGIPSADNLEGNGLIDDFSFGLLSLCLWDSDGTCDQFRRDRSTITASRGWEKIRFHAAWSTTTPMRAVEMNANQQLFFQQDEQQQELSQTFDTEWAGDMIVLESFSLDSDESPAIIDSQAEKVFDYADLFKS